MSYCCCGPFRTHVERGAFIIAIISAVLSIAQAIYCFLPFAPNFFIYSGYIAGGIHIFFAFVYLSIIYAQHKRNPSYYLPYLVIMGIGLILFAMVFFIVLGFLIAAPLNMTRNFRSINSEMDPVTTFRIFFGIAALIIALSIALETWFYSVVYRAYKFMKGKSYVGGVPTEHGHSYEGGGEAIQLV